MAQSSSLLTSILLLFVGGSVAGCAVESPNELLRKDEVVAAPEGDLQAAAEQAENDVVDGDTVFEGDVVLRGSNLQGIASAADAIKHWPGGVIPYELEPTLPNPERFASAVNHWHLKTGIRFVARTTEDDYVQVFAGNGCYSYIGRVGGAQKLSVGDKCNVGQIIHEIGHAVGLWHEHSRSDRDDYVKVLFENVAEGQEENFAKTTFTSIGSYDVGSVMHFGSSFFSKTGKNAFTMLKKDGSAITPNRSALSDKDVAGIAKLYEGEVLPVAGEKTPGGNAAKVTSTVNLRSGPSTNDAVVIVIPDGSTVLLTGQSQNGFLSAAYADQTGWVYGQYVAGQSSSSNQNPPPKPKKKGGVMTFEHTSVTKK